MTHSMQRTFLTGTGLSTTVGIALTVAGLLTSSRWQISLLVGLVSILIGVLLTALYAFGRRLDEIDERRIAVQPLQELYKVPHIEMPLVRIVDAVASTDQKRSPFLKNRTTRAVEQFSELVARMADGAFVCSSRGDELDLVKGALAATQRDVRAVASRGAKWWLEPEADVYFQAYEDEAHRLAITRIFLMRRDELERLRPMLVRNGQAGVLTYALDVDQIPPGRRRGLVLFDDALLHRAAPRPEGVSDPQDVEFTDVRDEIRRAEEDFEFLMSLATTRGRPSPAVLFSAQPRRFRTRIRGIRGLLA
jgi:PAS domain-containing protein